MTFTGLWYCIYTKPRQEKFAQEGLKSEGFDTYLPYIIKKTKSGRQFHEKKVPLFPCYIFVAITNPDQIMTLKSTRGVNYILRGQKNSPIEVPVDMLKQLESYCREGIFQPKKDEFQKGDHLELADSIYSGIEAVFQKYTPNKTRTIILLNILQGQHVEIKTSQIKKKCN
jgi:transcriptional antiterminator RfaH